MLLERHVKLKTLSKKCQYVVAKKLFAFQPFFTESLPFRGYIILTCNSKDFFISHFHSRTIIQFQLCPSYTTNKNEKINKETKKMKNKEITNQISFYSFISNLKVTGGPLLGLAKSILFIQFSQAKSSWLGLGLP